jgi:hypothetical protein
LFPREEPRSSEVLPRSTDSHRARTPARYKVIAEKRLVIVEFGRILTASVIAAYVASLRAHPEFDPSFSEILDLSAVEEIHLRGEEMMRLADRVDPFSFDSKRAFVVRDALHAHQARMYQILRNSGANIRAFHSVGEAERWILSSEPAGH